MRIIIDMQGLQSESSARGIGRYTLALTKAIIQNRKNHEIILFLNSAFPESIPLIKKEFLPLLPKENFHIWTPPAPPSDKIIADKSWETIANSIREACLLKLNPDVVIISSLFERLETGAVTGIGEFTNKIKTAVILYDLIPYIYPNIYLENPIYKSRYLSKIDHLKRADLLLAISEYSRQDAIKWLGLTSEKAVNISGAIDEKFKKLSLSPPQIEYIKNKHNLSQNFILYVGGIDHRKNIERLISAFSQLPDTLKSNYQLTIVCAITEADKKRLQALATKLKLNKKQLILTGKISDTDLIALYNLCALFVFPSWYEGFGLPLLEAMACGAPVIAANTSSLPEVVGLDEALFDPYSEESITEKMSEALINKDFIQRLRQNGLTQTKKFSWKASAIKTLTALEKLHTNSANQTSIPNILFNTLRRPRLAYISPLPPEQSGIANYSAELLPELSRYYKIDVIVNQKKVVDPWIESCYEIRNISFFKENHHCYDRILYHFGNSSYHQHMFDLLEHYPGIVVLHDFFLSNVAYMLSASGIIPGLWSKSLYSSHGLSSVIEDAIGCNPLHSTAQYPCNLSILQHALGIISHSQYSYELAKTFYNKATPWNWFNIPLLRISANTFDKKTSRKRLNLTSQDFIVCSFGILGPAKQNLKLLEAWIHSPLYNDPNAKLIFVGQCNEPYLSQIKDFTEKHRFSQQITITGWIDQPTFENYLAAGDIAVQLRTESRGETSAAILDCLNYQIPSIINANGAMAELPDDVVYKIPDDFTEIELLEGLVTLSHNESLRKKLAHNGKEFIKNKHNPANCAMLYNQAIESTYAKSDNDLFGLLKFLKDRCHLKELDKSVVVGLSQAIEGNFPRLGRKRKLYLDISSLSQVDSKTGIQRTVKNILKEWLISTPTAYEVTPVYADTKLGIYRHAIKYIETLFNLNSLELNENPIEPHRDDIFLGLDLVEYIPSLKNYFTNLMNRGIKVYFILYDLLPIFHPNKFPQDSFSTHTAWLKTVAQSDGAICISKAVANELAEWMENEKFERALPFQIGWFHLGADIDASFPSKGLPTTAENLLDTLNALPTFLMVGTMEPRKGHAQVLSAFEKLWEKGKNINLVIVGKEGWMVSEFIKQLKSHPEFNKHLFWLNAISDEYVNKIYAASSCLIAASEGEGFGLPLIEAAQHSLPIIARDIPVFKEVAGEHAYYFHGLESEPVAKAIVDWLSLYEKNEHPQSKNMPWQTWKQSAEQLLAVILNNEWYTSYPPEIIEQE